jgi:hypothetical protein
MTTPAPAQDVRPRDEKADIDREDTPGDGGKAHLHRHPEEAAGERAREPKRQPLDHVDRETPAGACPQAAEHRDCRDLLADVGMERARDTDPAEDKGHEPHEAEKGVEVVQRLAEVALALLHRLEREAQRGEPCLQVPDDRVGIASGRKLHHGAVTGERPGAKETGSLQRSHRDIGPRRHHRDARGFARDLP